MIIKHVFAAQRANVYVGAKVTARPANGRTVMVGFAREPTRALKPANDNVIEFPVTMSLGGLSELVKGCGRADLILTPLIAKKFDALEMAKRLSDLGYTGQYKAVVSSLPDCAMVIREIKGLNPHLDFDIVQLGAL